MLQSIVLGLVQGLTEFLPVSSSGHLVIVPYLFGWPQPDLAYDVALHAGTLLALLVYFAGDLWFLASRSLGFGGSADEVRRARRTVGLLVVGTIPAGVVGLLFDDFFERVFAEPRIAAGFLFVTAGMLYGAERLRRQRAAAAIRVHAGGGDEPVDVPPDADVGRDESTVGWLDALAVGAAQALAIFPGISRAGATISAGMVRGLSRAAAARFAFLLAIPAIAGATVVKFGEFTSTTEASIFTGTQTLAGVAVAAVSGYWAIWFLLRLVQREDLTGFARYVILVAVLTLFGSLWLGPPSTI